MGLVQMRTLSQKYVFYEYLKEEENPALVQLYHNVRGSLDVFDKHYDKGSIAAKQLFALANSELTKEISALQTIFGTQGLDKLDFNNPSAMKTLIEAFNSTLNLKKNFERNVARISKLPKQQINIASFFDTYFSKTWDENKARIAAEIGKLDLRNGDLVEQADKLLTVELTELVKISIKKMFSSNTFKDKEQSEDEKAYTELLNIFDDYPQSNWLTQQLYDTYNIDQIKTNIMSSLKENMSIQGARDAAIAQSGKIVGEKGHYTKGGLSLEYLENFIANSIIDGLAGDNNVRFSGKAIHTGASGMKADNIITFNFDPTIVEEAVQKIAETETSRQNIIKGIEQMKEKMAGLHDGFIIYSSAKNYTSQADKQFDGFSGGEPVKLQNANKILDGNKIGAILQTISGAVGDNMSYQESLRLSIAENIASLLFDDFDVSGLEKINDGPTALHVFDLDGIYVPLSILAYKMAKAIENAKKSPTSLLTVSIKVPDRIMYENNYEIAQARLQGERPWEEQRRSALDNSTIAVHFFKDFFEMIRDFYGRMY